MNRPIFVLLFAAVGILHGSGPAAEAQMYQPPRPTISPWMYLFQRNAGPIGNYHSYVRPEMQLRDTLRQQNMRIQQQNAALQATGQQVQEIEGQRTIRPTGTGSVFMDYSHYYETRVPIRGVRPGALR
jgi:hypothetical protein